MLGWRRQKLTACAGLALLASAITLPALAQQTTPPSPTTAQAGGTCTTIGSTTMDSGQNVLGCMSDHIWHVGSTSDVNLNFIPPCPPPAADPTQHYVLNTVVANNQVNFVCIQVGSNNPINGACGTAVNTCSAGAFVPGSDNGTTTTWTCQGSNGGTNASCSAPDGGGGGGPGSGAAYTPTPVGYTYLGPGACTTSSPATTQLYPVFPIPNEIPSPTGPTYSWISSGNVKLGGALVLEPGGSPITVNAPCYNLPSTNPNSGANCGGGNFNLGAVWPGCPFTLDDGTMTNLFIFTDPSGNVVPANGYYDACGPSVNTCMSGGAPAITTPGVQWTCNDGLGPNAVCQYDSATNTICQTGLGYVYDLTPSVPVYKFCWTAH